MCINTTWHDRYKLRSNAMPEERIRWHKEHAKECGCRPIPDKIKEKMQKEVIR